MSYQEAEISKAQQLLENQKFDEAHHLANAVLKNYPYSLEALQILGKAKAAQGYLPEAIRIFEKLCLKAPAQAQFHSDLGRFYARAGQYSRAAVAVQKAVVHDPDVTDYKVQLSRFAGLLNYQKFTPISKKIIQACLEDEWVQHYEFTHAWGKLLKLDPMFSVLWEFHKTKELNLHEEQVINALNDPFLLIGLKRLFLCDVEFEKLFTHLRSYILQKSDEDLSKLTPFLAALANHCFFTEYAFLTSVEEEEKVDDLEVNTELDTDTDNVSKVLLVACYKPLIHTRYAQEAESAQVQSFYLEDVLKVQIRDVFEEHKIQKNIRSFSSIEDKTSKIVKDMYEQNPYPRWQCINMHHNIQAVKDAQSDKLILNAGCGTGMEALTIASLYYPARVLGVDLSLASLSYASRKAQELGFDNADFMQADILELHKLQDRFDFISSSGVLHHMQDPVAGWKSLAAVLKDDGVMRIGLYTESARQDIVAARNIVSENNYESTTEGIRAFRKHLMELDDRNPARHLTKRYDFYAISPCRDMSFHPMEHRYSIPEIADIARDLGLTLAHVEFSGLRPRERYKEMFPDRKGRYYFEDLYALEQKYPRIFNSVYSFWYVKEGVFDNPCLPDWIKNKINV